MSTFVVLLKRQSYQESSSAKLKQRTVSAVDGSLTLSAFNSSFFLWCVSFLSFPLCASPQPLWLQRQAPTSLWLTWTAPAITTSTRWPWGGARSPPPPPPGTHEALETLLLNLILPLAILHSPTSVLCFLMLSLLCFLIMIFLSPSSSLTLLVPTHISHRSVCHPFLVCVCFPLLCRPLPLILRCRTEMELYASLPRR